jgi:hypothetical protein
MLLIVVFLLNIALDYLRPKCYIILIGTNSRAKLPTNIKEFMKTSTLVAIKAILDADKPVSEKDKQTLRSTLLGDSDKAKPDRLVRIKDAASRLGVCAKSVLLYTRTGALTAIRLPGQIRVSGVTESSLNKLFAEV